LRVDHTDPHGPHPSIVNTSTSSSPSPDASPSRLTSGTPSRSTR
jgi:hypothetical protein